MNRPRPAGRRTRKATPTRTRVSMGELILKCLHDSAFHARLMRDYRKTLAAKHLRLSRVQDECFSRCINASRAGGGLRRGIRGMLRSPTVWCQYERSITLQAARRAAQKRKG